MAKKSGDRLSQALLEGLKQESTSSEDERFVEQCRNLDDDDCLLAPMEDDGEDDDEDSPSSMFAFDIFNRQAQGILNRSLDKAKHLSADCKDALRKALKIKDPAQMAIAIVEAIGKYRLQLASLLTTTQLASLLAGAKEVVQQIPTVPIFPSHPPPVSLEPQEAVDLVSRIKELEPIQREYEIAALTPDEQVFVRHQLIAEQQQPAVKPLPLSVTMPERGEAGRIHYAVIDEAAEELSKKNVIDRAGFDRLEDAARSKAFTVTGVDSQETLEKIRDALAANIAEGVDVQAGREKILESVDEGTFLSPWHLETIIRTNVQVAFSDGQMKVLQHRYVQSGFPYSSYEAIDDDRVRHNHLALMTLGIQKTNIYRTADPVFQTFRPPWDFCDRCSWIPLTVRMAAARGILEAIEWLRTGIEPSPPAFVAMPPFQPPAGFKRSLSGSPLSIQLSLRIPIEAEWIPVSKLKDMSMAFDHGKILADSMKEEKKPKRKSRK